MRFGASLTALPYVRMVERGFYVYNTLEEFLYNLPILMGKESKLVSCTGAYYLDLKNQWQYVVGPQSEVNYRPEYIPAEDALYSDHGLQLSSSMHKFVRIGKTAPSIHPTSCGPLEEGVPAIIHGGNFHCKGKSPKWKKQIVKRDKNLHVAPSDLWKVKDCTIKPIRVFDQHGEMVYWTRNIDSLKWIDLYWDEDAQLYRVIKNLSVFFSLTGQKPCMLCQSIHFSSHCRNHLHGSPLIKTSIPFLLRDMQSLDSTLYIINKK